MFINEKKNAIELTKKESAAAAKFGTPEYRALQEARKDYPGFKVVTITRKSTTKKESCKGLTYDYMKTYIILHTTPEEEAAAVAEFDELILISKCQQQSLRYPTIKKWFLNKYPEVAKFGTIEAEYEAQATA